MAEALDVVPSMADTHQVIEVVAEDIGGPQQQELVSGKRSWDEANSDDHLKKDDKDVLFTESADAAAASAVVVAGVGTAEDEDPMNSSDVGGGTPNSKKAKQHRQQKTENAKQVLEQIYLRQQYISRGDMTALAQRLGLSFSQVCKWFDNRRNRKKRGRNASVVPEVLPKKKASIGRPRRSVERTPIHDVLDKLPMSMGQAGTPLPSMNALTSGMAVTVTVTGHGMMSPGPVDVTAPHTVVATAEPSNATLVESLRVASPSPSHHVGVLHQGQHDVQQAAISLLAFSQPPHHEVRIVDTIKVVPQIQMMGSGLAQSLGPSIQYVLSNGSMLLPGGVLSGDDPSAGGSM